MNHIETAHAQITDSDSAGFLNSALLHSAIMEMEILKRKEYLTEEEAAKLYSLSAATLRTERSRGRGPRFVKKGRKVLYKKSELDDYLERRLVLVDDPAAVLDA
jgi:predicted DNA-binding transcriptional regulator AlpA